MENLATSGKIDGILEHTSIQSVYQIALIPKRNENVYKVSFF